ncbi:basic-leucine zipper transcription factor A-like isoform X2 [Uranotaenia lowii]|uniref:basic-leucine zipper transcription factor A-like isoform X2 n=1 Tax=Uranotaenia lowii TaxID=190385 RepID=UPI00247A2DBA|nr:basic-leucine zipper transcription factor A-like isoform X2 [Uranotaenia lowii]
MKPMSQWMTLGMLMLMAAAMARSDDQMPQESKQQKQLHTQKVTDDAKGSNGNSGGGGGGTGRILPLNGPDKNKRGTPYINQPVVAAAASPVATSAVLSSVAIPAAGAGTLVGPVTAYTSYGYPHVAGSSGALVQNVAASSPQALYHKLNYAIPGSTALKVATYAAAPAHYEYSAAPTATVTKYNYAAAASPVAQYTQYAHYPQYQLQYHHHPGQQQQPAAIISSGHHPAQATAIYTTTHHHHQQQQQQQPGATAIHYALAQPAGVVQQLQHNYQHPIHHEATAIQGPTTVHFQQQQQHHHQHPAGATLVGVQPAVPVIHQAPIAAINQLHHPYQQLQQLQQHHHQQQQQQQQLHGPVIATQAQLNKYAVPTSAPIYATAAPSHLYQQQATNYGYPISLASKQILSTVAAPTIATPAHHLKQLIPVSTTAATQHHAKGFSYASYSHQQPGSPAYLGPIPVNSAAPHQYFNPAGHVYQQQQPQQSHRYQLFSTVPTPIQKQGGLIYAANAPAAIYATPGTPLIHHPQHHAHHQQQLQAQSQQSLHYAPHFYQQAPQAFAPVAAKFTYSQPLVTKGFYPIQ